MLIYGKTEVRTEQKLLFIKGTEVISAVKPQNVYKSNVFDIWLNIT